MIRYCYFADYPSCTGDLPIDLNVNNSIPFILGLVFCMVSILYSVLLGLFCNLKFPKFNWEN